MECHGVEHKHIRIWKKHLEQPTISSPLHLLHALHVLAYNLTVFSVIAFAAGSFGVLENRIFEIFSQTPKLPIAKATITEELSNLVNLVNPV